MSDHGSDTDSRSSTPRILLAEDNAINQKVILLILDRMGFSADTVSNGVEALEILESESYDIVLMDMQMPEMGGLEATRGIRERLSPDEQPLIVALTANAQAADRQRCLAAGMDEFLGKPLDKDMLRTVIESAHSPT